MSKFRDFLPVPPWEGLPIPRGWHRKEKGNLGEERRYGGEDYEYREWMIDRIEDYTGKIYDIGNLHAESLEKLYREIVKNDPKVQFRLAIRR